MPFKGGLDRNIMSYTTYKIKTHAQLGGSVFN